MTETDFTSEGLRVLGQDKVFKNGTGRGQISLSLETVKTFTKVEAECLLALTSCHAKEVTSHLCSLPFSGQRERLAVAQLPGLSWESLDDVLI